MAAEADPNRAQVAGVLPPADGRDVDSEEVGHLADPEQALRAVHLPTTQQNCALLGNTQRTLPDGALAVDYQAEVGGGRGGRRTPQLGYARLAFTCGGSLAQEALGPGLGKLERQPPG